MNQQMSSRISDVIRRPVLWGQTTLRFPIDGHVDILCDCKQINPKQIIKLHDICSKSN